MYNPTCLHIMHIPIQKAVGKSFELGSTLTPKSKGPKSDPSRPCERRRCWSFIAGPSRNTKRASIIWSRQGEGHFQVRGLAYIYICHILSYFDYFVMLGLHHHHHHHHMFINVKHQFTVHCTIGSTVLYIDGMAWGCFWNLDLTLRWYSPADTHWVTWHGDDLNCELALVTFQTYSVLKMLFWCLKCSPSFSQTWRFDPPSQRGSTVSHLRYQGNSSTELVMWRQVEHWWVIWTSMFFLNVVLQTYSVLEILVFAWPEENLDGFLSVKLGAVPTRWNAVNTGTIRYIHTSVFKQCVFTDN